MATWDETKRRSNLRKHGVDLAIAGRFDFGTAAIREDDSEFYGEQRQIAIGWIGAELYTLRGEEDHAISLRKANRKDWHTYAKEA